MLCNGRTAQTRNSHLAGLGKAELAARPLRPLLVAKGVEGAQLERRHLEVKRLDAMVVAGDGGRDAAAETGAPHADPGWIALRLRLQPVDRVRQILDLGQRIEDFPQLDDLRGETTAGSLSRRGTRQYHARVALPPTAIVEHHDEIAGLAKGHGFRAETLHPAAPAI